MNKFMTNVYKNLPSRFDKTLRYYFTIKVEARYLLQMRKKGVHPRRIYYTSPESINSFVPPNTGFTVRSTGCVSGGDWDVKSRKFENYILYQSLYNRFERGFQWEETAQYQQCKIRIENGESCWHGCNSMQDLEDRCKYLDKLFRSIVEQGYKRQTKLDNLVDGNSSPYPSTLREITVNIGRDGSLILLDGRHRLFITKIIGIDTIPIHIGVVHSDWEGGWPDNSKK